MESDLNIVDSGLRIVDSDMDSTVSRLDTSLILKCCRDMDRCLAAIVSVSYQELTGG